MRAVSLAATGFFVFLLTQVKYDCGVTVEPGAILTPTQVRRETPYKEALVPRVNNDYTSCRSRMLQW